MSSEPGFEQEQVLQDITKHVIQQLTSGKRQKTIVKKLVKSGLSKDSSRQLVSNLANELDAYKKSPEGRSFLAAKNKKRMLQGLAWTVVGLIITSTSYASASDQGGTYLICWGAVLFGFIDFLIGLFGWLTYR